MTSNITEINAIIPFTNWKGAIILFLVLIGLIITSKVVYEIYTIFKKPAIESK